MSVQRQEQPVREVSIDAMRDDRLSSRQDLVVVEEPLEIRIAPGRRNRARHVDVDHHAHARPGHRARSRIPARRRHRPHPRRRRRQPHLRPGRQRRADPARRGRRARSRAPATQFLYDLELRRLRQRLARRGRAHAALAERGCFAHGVGRADRVALRARACRPGRIPRDGRPARFLPVRCRAASSSTCARTSAGTTRSTS